MHKDYLSGICLLFWWQKLDVGGGLEIGGRGGVLRPYKETNLNFEKIYCATVWLIFGYCKYKYICFNSCMFQILEVGWASLKEKRDITSIRRDSLGRGLGAPERENHLSLLWCSALLKASFFYWYLAPSEIWCETLIYEWNENSFFEGTKSLLSPPVPGTYPKTALDTSQKAFKVPKISSKEGRREWLAESWNMLAAERTFVLTI